MSKKMWMIRAGSGGSQLEEFMEGSIIALGWDELGQLDPSISREELKKEMLSLNPDFSPNKLGQSAGQLWKFISEVKNDDEILSYDSQARLYYLGTIAGSYFFKENRSNYKQCRGVNWHPKPVERDSLSTASRNVLGSTLTLFEIPEAVADEIEDVHLGVPTDEELEEMEKFHEEMMLQEQQTLMEDAVARSSEFIKDRMFEIEPEQMERYVAGILRAMGYRTQMTPAGKDGGSDIFASPDGLGMVEPRIKVEVKHWVKSKKKVGTPEVRNFIGGLRGHHKGLFVSTTGFSLEARYELERANFQIAMIDGDRLVELLIEHYESLDPETKAIIPLKKVYWPA